MEQFFCIELLLGKAKLKVLHKSFVVVIGLGAVGSYAVEGLARAGVGKFRIVDFDKIKPTNLNRHLLATHCTLGRSKAELVKERILSINPKAKVEALEIFAAQETLDGILDDSPNLVIDAIDSLNPKVQLLDACYRKGIPVISSMGAATRLDPFLIRSGDLFDSTNCPLAQKLRKRLRKLGIKRGIFSVWSEEKPNLGFEEPENSPLEDSYMRGRSRKKLGSLPTLTAIFGLIIAHKAMEFLCKGLKKDIK